MLMLHAGDFGQAVSNELVDIVTYAVDITPGNIEVDELIAKADFVGVALWHPYNQAFEHIDNLCNKHGVPWTFVQVEGQVLICGPIVKPGKASGCFHCYKSRTNSHSFSDFRRKVVMQAYDKNPELGSLGYTDAMKVVGAASIWQGFNDQLPPRLFRCMDVVTGNVMETKLVPLHDCPRCRPQTTTQAFRNERYTTQLVEKLKNHRL